MKNILLSLLALSAVGAIAWLFVGGDTPPPAKPAASTQAKADAPTQRQAEPAAAPGLALGAGAQKIPPLPPGDVNDPAYRAQVRERAAAAFAASEAQLEAAEMAQAIKLAQEGPVVDVDTGRGDGRGDGPPKISSYTQVKSTLQTFYDSLPAGKAMPSKVLLEDILPTEAIQHLNLLPTGRVTQLGHQPLDSSARIQQFLNSDDRTPLGITVITNDGREMRDYIFFE